jgi:hypothetical protein
MFLVSQAIGLALDTQCNRLFQKFFLIRHELMQGRINQADDNRITVHRFEETVEVLALVGEKLVESCRAAFATVRKNHALDDRQAFGLEEHVLGAAQTNAHSTIRAGTLCILRVICIRPYLKPAGGVALGGRFAHVLAGCDLICPREQGQ